jgi:glucose/arabinose dehydrogenase
MRRGLLLLLLTAVALACSSAAEPVPVVGELNAVEIASGFSSPIFVSAPAGDARLFVVEQGGRIRIIENGQTLAEPFLDITAFVRSGGEQGLFSMAFHPAYATNGRFFVSYTDAAGASRVDRFTVGTDPNRADPASRTLVLQVAQPFANHNGGMIGFAPDGRLWIALGDGGSGGDPHGHGQNRATLLGAILRIDVNSGDPYGIPAGNPYIGMTGARPEIWAIGLRNPWRFAFDAQRGHVYIADVGQQRREEINVQPLATPGLNYGWNRMEGTLCYDPATGCNTAGLVLPVLEYATGAEGCAVTGGYVYRGSAMPALHGHYFYSDFCRGWLRSFRHSGGSIHDARSWDVGTLGRVMSFGEDGAGELYVVVQEGRIYRLEAH